MKQTIILRYEDRTSQETVERFIQDFCTSTSLTLNNVPRASKRFSSKADTINSICIKAMSDIDADKVISYKANKLLHYSGSIPVRLLILPSPVVDLNRQIFLRGYCTPTMQPMDYKDLFKSMKDELFF